MPIHRHHLGFVLMALLPLWALGVAIAAERPKKEREQPAVNLYDLKAETDFTLSLIHI
jgi:hypothetical protein